MSTHDEDCQDDCFGCRMRAQDKAEAREATANRVYSIVEHVRDRRHAANLAARWQG